MFVMRSNQVVETPSYRLIVSVDRGCNSKRESNTHSNSFFKKASNVYSNLLDREEMEHLLSESLMKIY